VVNTKINVALLGVGNCASSLVQGLQYYSETKTEDGLKDVDAENTAFGTPPICVLRVGDFYHTKIVVDSVSFTYDPLIYDLNQKG